ncbi:MAG: sigma-70 family RNA polymerase sigma factor [Acidobacteriota bacterium]|nr:sigma-70 family RNA polymerase sigma factor [Acidobacteriota bacterium]
MNDSSGDRNKIDELLEAISGGSSEAIGELMPLIYGELRRQAHSILRRERQDHTLRTTALVHEAYIRLAGGTFRNWKNRSHFFHVAARVMRRVLIQHARKRLSIKRGGKYKIVPMEEEGGGVPDFGKDENLIRLDEALIKLEGVDKTLAGLVENRFFAGLTIDETAQVMNMSPATVKRKWELAKAWLLREIYR